MPSCEIVMDKIRLLLPFTSGIDTKAFDHVLLFAKSSQSLLVTLALTATSEDPSRCSSTHLQPAQEMLQTQLKRSDVTFEHHEVATHAIPECILNAAQKLDCNAILLVFDKEKPLFLPTNAIKQLRQSASTSLYILQLPRAKQKQVWKQFFQFTKDHQLKA